MIQSLIILDNFYQDVDSVRQFALSQEYNVTGNYPGRRTVPLGSESAKKVIADVLRPVNGEITVWDTGDDSYNGSFQYTTKHDKSWIHDDKYTTWAAVCYLTPNAPVNSGTALFTHKATGLNKTPYKQNGDVDFELLNEIYKDSQDMSKWNLNVQVSNVYNRLVMYRGYYFHTSLEYFGNDLNDGRLFQTFFFSTEY